MVEFVPATSSGRGDPVGEEADNGIVIERREKFSAVCKWQIKEFSKMKQRTTRCLYSRYFEVGGFDCRLLVYPAGAYLPQIDLIRPDLIRPEHFKIPDSYVQSDYHIPHHTKVIPLRDL